MTRIKLSRPVPWQDVVFALGLVLGLLAAQYATGDIPGDIAILLSSGQSTTKPEDVSEAWKRLVSAGPDALGPLFVAARQADPASRNWLLSAADQIVAREHGAGRHLSQEIILKLLEDTQNPPQGRWWAYQWLARQDPAQARQILIRFLNDPASELRRAAIEAELQALGDIQNVPVNDPKNVEIVRKLKQLFDAARDQDQVENLAEMLRKRGVSVDLAGHYGYLRTWWIVGPFDNQQDVGFDAIYPPEGQSPPDFSATYQGKHGPVTWKKVTTPDEHGTLDLNKVLGEEKGVVAYAVAALVSQTEQAAEIRAATPNAIKIWCNGQPLGAFHVYHSGFEDDQYRVVCRLQPGVNWIMIKVCQNEQTQDWAQYWTFRLRVCDELGKGLGRQPD